MSALETKRLILRNFILSDWVAINEVLADPDVTQYMHFAAWSEEQRYSWLDWCIANGQQPAPDANNWAVCLKESGSLIGWLGIGSASHPTVDHERVFGYALNRRFWGQGYMTEALQAVLAYEFETLGTQRIVATCETPNVASARVMEKAGMRFEGTFYDADFEGNWANRHRYAIHAHEYRPQGG